MALRVGVFSANLSQTRPRGVARVARAFAEHLARADGIEVFSLTAPWYDFGDIMVEHYILSEYLERVPLVTPTRKPVVMQKPRIRNKIARRFTWITRDPWAKWGLHISRHAGIYHEARAA
jgi:hypothetical protein